jgi:hypothetical protein
MVSDLRHNGVPRAVLALEALVVDRRQSEKVIRTNRTRGDASGHQGLQV